MQKVKHDPERRRVTVNEEGAVDHGRPLGEAVRRLFEPALYIYINRQGKEMPENAAQLLRGRFEPKKKLVQSDKKERKYRLSRSHHVIIQNT